MTLAAGSSLGPYEVQSRIGAGGMGEVYRARDTTLGRDVAIKVLPQAFAQDPERLARFEREAKTLAALNHPSIAQIYGLERVAGFGGVSALVMELVEGETLRGRIAGGPLPVPAALDVAIALADALAAVHAKGITHRDLKPENIILTADGRIKILDFGLARWQAQSDADQDLTVPSDATQAGVMMGTVGYMSPEQVRGEKVEATSDIFSLGCVVYEMLTARRAFERATPADTLAAILKEDPALEGVPSQVRRVVARCLEKYPRERFQSARDLAFDLRGLATARDTDAEPGDSLAVVPFTNAGGPDAEYLSDGIAESLTNAFSQIPRLRIVPRSLVSRYKGREIDPRVVGAELGARMLLSGKVVERGGRLSVQVELVDAAANKQLWGERLHRPIADIFEVEEEITRQIVDKLRVRLSGDEQKQLVRRSTEDSEAYQLYLKARYHFLRRTVEGLEKSIQLCEQAIERDPNFALAHAAITDSCLVLISIVAYDPRPIRERAKTAALRAVEADPALAEAHNALAYARVCCDRDWLGAEQSFRHALTLNPSAWIAHDWYALTLAAQNRIDDALTQNRLAQELEPLSVVLHHHAAWVLFLGRRYAEAVEQSRRTLELEPTFPFAFLWSGLALEQQSNSEEAIAALKRASELTGGIGIIQGALGHALVKSGRREEAEAFVRELERSSATRYVEPYSFALIDVARGDVEGAFSWLEKACQTTSSWITLFLKSDPRMDVLRSDPRFADLLARMRLN
jgi:eukaryotic-like serine/threonine-protein kinase